jgi:hypothetical protein
VDRAVEAERPALEVIEGHRRAEIHAHIEVSLAEKAAGTVRFTVVRPTSWPSSFSTTSAGESGWALARVVMASMRCRPAGILLFERAV